MAWNYDATNLGTDTDSERLNTVRFLIGDTNTQSQQIQDEEIAFTLSQSSDDVYKAAGFVCRAIAALYSRRVDTELDGALKAKYSTLSKTYMKLAESVEMQGKLTSGKSLGLYVGGISESGRDTVRLLTDRITPAFYRDRFTENRGDTYVTIQ